MQVDKKGNLIPFGAAAKGVFMDVSKRGDRFPRLTSLRERVCEREMKRESAQVKAGSMKEI